MKKQRNRKGKGNALGVKTPSANPDHRTPLPALLDGREWKILDSGSYNGTAYIQRPSGDGPGTMRVPLGADEGERRVRLHEMAHVRWTPATASPATLPSGVSWDTFNAVEDCRMHKRLREVGFGDSLDAPCFRDEDWEHWHESFQRDAAREPGQPPKWTPLEVARMVAASEGVQEGEPFQEMLATYGWDWVTPLVREILGRTVLTRRPSFKQTIQAAVEIEALFGSMPTPSPEESYKRLHYRPKDPDYDAVWGEMTITEMPLTVPMPRRMKIRKRRATDTGCIPRNWHRLPIDQRVFTRTKGKPAGGTVLMDQSGSMDMNVDQVMQLMAMYPAVTIATYAGSRISGELRIIARDGRRAIDELCLHPMDGNTVDGPALEWLARQPGPRIWISDGYVVGANNAQCKELLDECDDICTRASITRVEAMSELIGEMW